MRSGQCRAASVKSASVVRRVSSWRMQSWPSSASIVPIRTPARRQTLRISAASMSSCRSGTRSGRATNRRTISLRARRPAKPCSSSCSTSPVVTITSPPSIAARSVSTSGPEAGASLRKARDQTLVSTSHRQLEFSALCSPAAPRPARPAGRGMARKVSAAVPRPPRAGRAHRRAPAPARRRSSPPTRIPAARARFPGCRPNRGGFSPVKSRCGCRRARPRRTFP